MAQQLRPCRGRTAGCCSQGEYFAYGRSSDRRDARNRYRFIGVERDEDTGLCMTGPRTYDPVTGRFLQGDPVVGGAPYVYSRGNPVGRLDENGYTDEAVDAADIKVEDPLPANMSIDTINRLFKETIAVAFGDTDPAMTERGARERVPVGDGPPFRSGGVLGNQPRVDEDGNVVLSVNIPDEDHIDATAGPRADVDTFLHTHPQSDTSVVLPSSDPPKRTDLKDYLEEPEDRIVGVIVRDRHHDQDDQRRFQATIIYRGTIGKFDRPELASTLRAQRAPAVQSRRDVGRYLAGVLPGTDIRVYKAVFKDGQLSKLRQRF